MGVLIYLLIWHSLSWFLYMLCTLVLLVLGAVISQEGLILFGEEDSSHIVIDEVVGFLIAMWGVGFSMWAWLLGFLLFRIWDIWKPFSFIEEIPGGWGVMLDDVAAGVMTNIMLRIVF
jgi:phosphatidylglycerophosphatase A